MNRFLRGSVAVVLLATGAITSAATPVAAASSAGMCSTQWSAFGSKPSISTARAVGHCEIDRRLTDLTSLKTAAADASVLTVADRSTIDHTVDRTRSGLKSLDAKLGRDTTLAALGPDLDAIVDDYRVYVLVVRQSWLACAADGELAAVAAFGKVDDSLGSAIDIAKAAGYDTSTAEAARAAMEADVASAGSLIHGLDTKLLALSVAQYAAGTAAPTMDSARQNLDTSYASLLSARAHAAAAADALRALASH